jgi:hypothetical protein
MPALGMDPTQVMKVLGPVCPGQLGVSDAHSHLWIDVVQGSTAGSLVLNNYGPTPAVLKGFGRKGGTTVLDCQPGCCGRNVSRLADFSREGGVWIGACTGFHRRRHYPMDFRFWRVSAERAAQPFVDEATHGLEEARERPEPGYGRGPGLGALVCDVVPRLQSLGRTEREIRGLVGEKTKRRLAGSEGPTSRS